MKTFSLMRFITLILVVSLLVTSCQEKTNKNSCEKIERKYDSLLKLNEDHRSSSFYKFNEIYEKEEQSLVDTILISEYQSILSDDEVVNSYIHNRVNTISQKKTKKVLLEKFNGKHILKTNYNDFDRYVTSVEIKNDSCYIFKDKKLITSGGIKLIYSRNKLTPGAFSLDNYLIKLIQPNLILLRDKNCLHCSPLEFIKAR